MGDIASLSDRRETDFEIELPPAEATRLYESRFTMTGGGLSRINGTKRYIAVFHDGGDAQGTSITICDADYGYRIERTGRGTMSVRICQGDETYHEFRVQMEALEEDCDIELRPDLTLTIRRRLPRPDLMTDLFRRANA